MGLAALSILLIGLTGFLYILSWLLTIYHSSQLDNYKLSILLGLIPISIIFYQIHFRKETKKAQILLLSALVLSFITYHILQLTAESLDSIARNLSP